MIVNFESGYNSSIRQSTFIDERVWETWARSFVNNQDPLHFNRNRFVKKQVR